MYVDDFNPLNDWECDLADEIDELGVDFYGEVKVCKAS